MPVSHSLYHISAVQLACEGEHLRKTYWCSRTCTVSGRYPADTCSVRLLGDLVRVDGPREPLGRVLECRKRHARDASCMVSILFSLSRSAARLSAIPEASWTLQTHMSSTISLAISRFEYSTWLSLPFGLDDRPYPLKSAQTTVRVSASCGAVKRHILVHQQLSLSFSGGRKAYWLVCGWPCRSNMAGPEPAVR